MSNALTVQDYNAPTAYDAFDHDDPDASPIRGSNVKFDAGAYYTGKEKTLVKPDRRFVAIDKAAGWQFLKKDCPAEWVMATPGQPTPERPECGDESDWPVDLSGNPSCPWKYAHFLYLMDIDSGQTLTFSSSTSGGKVAINELTQQIKSMRTMSPGAMPVIALESVQMSTKFGKKPRPSFRILNWRDRTNRQEMDPDQGLPPYDGRDYEADEAAMTKLRDAENVF
jgi:hypothetical protein